jgi:hypothetical protein
MRTPVGLVHHIRYKHPELLFHKVEGQTVVNLPASGIPQVKDPNYVETDANIVTFSAPNATVEIPNADGVTVIGEPAKAEEGEIPLAEEAKPTLTKELLKGLLEEVLEEQQEAKDKEALKKAVNDAAAESTEARELAGKACKGVECIQETIDLIGTKLDTIAKSVAEPPAEIQPPPAPVIATPPVELAEGPAGVIQPVVAPVPVEEHNHDHPAHLSSTEMAEGVLDRIMSCDECSPAMKEALKRRLHKYIPEYGMDREEATGGDDLREAKEETQTETEKALEQHSVAGGGEAAVDAEAKAKAEAGAGAAVAEPAGEPVAPAAAATSNAAPAADGDGAGDDPTPESTTAPKSLEERKKDPRDPLGWI